MAILGTTTQS